MKIFNYFFLALVFIFSQSYTNNKEIDYELKRYYSRSNPDVRQHFYIETPERYDTIKLKKLIEIFHADFPQKTRHKIIFFTNKDKYFAKSTLREDYWENYKSIKILFHEDYKEMQLISEENKKLYKNSKKDVSGSIGVWLWAGDISIIKPVGENSGYTFCPLKRLIKWNQRHENLKPKKGPLKKDNDEQFYKLFSRFGDKSKVAFSHYISNPYKNTSYTNVYYINDYGDLIIMDSRDTHAMSIYTNVEHLF